jgi:beta-N-acetylhexosaminidase
VDSRQVISHKLLLAFKGKDRPSEEIINSLRVYGAGGISLFRSFNIDNPSQLLTLTNSLQRLARDLNLPPLIIGTDQEGGQLMAVGDGTPLPGNMALGATGSEDLAYRAGRVLGSELAAMGVNVNYAPCVDVNVNPFNPVVGVRSFGENPEEVARLSAAMITGMQSQGVAATAKHFPGHGDTASDSHHGMPTILHGMERLQAVEFPPFRASINAGVKLVMSAHVGLPAIDGMEPVPATLSKNILTGILRHQLGYEGVIITDALDMRAIRQGDLLGEDAVRAVAAGADLLLVTSDPGNHKRVHAALMQALQDGTLDMSELEASVQRVLSLRKWLFKGWSRPELTVICSGEHMQVAQEIADASITLVRDRTGILPVRLSADQRIAVILPRPLDLTPADTSSYVVPALAEALREYHSGVDEFIIPHLPQARDITAIVEQAKAYNLIVIGTLNAFQQTGQVELVLELLRTNIPTAVIALRLPYDLMAFPDAPAYLCTYGILEPSMRSVAKVLFGRRSARGKLPVSIPGLYSAGFSSQKEL